MCFLKYKGGNGLLGIEPRTHFPIHYEPDKADFKMMTVMMKM